MYENEMPLDDGEVVALSAKTLALLEKIKGYRAEDSPGGKKIARSEGRALVRDLAALLAQATVDVLD
jgi:hypothetical protein